MNVLHSAAFLLLTTPLFAQTPASFTPYGSGCNGTAPSNCLTLNDTNPTLLVASLPNEYAYPVLNTTGLPIQVVGFEVFTQSNTALTETANAGILFDAAGSTVTAHTAPAFTNTANGTITANGTPGWCSVQVYPPVTIGAGVAFWFHVDAYSRIAPPQHVTTGGVTGPVANYWRRPNYASYAWTVSGSVARQIFRIHCVPAAPTVPSLLASNPPQLGQNFSLSLAGGQPNLIGFAIWSFDNTQWASLPTPIDLSIFGAPSCFNYTSAETLNTLVLDGSGAASTLPLTIPTAPAYMGLTWYNQGAVLAPGVNTLSMLFSNAATAVVGQ